MSKHNNLIIDAHNAQLESATCPFCFGPITPPEQSELGCCSLCSYGYDHYQASPADIPDDGRYHRDEYEPWETPEWFTDGPGSMNDPRHFQGIHAVRLG